MSIYKLKKIKYSLTTKREVEIVVYKKVSIKPQSKTRGGKYNGCINIPTEFVGRDVIVGILKEV